MDLQKKIAKEQIELREDFYPKVALFQEELFRWNKIHNLTAVESEAKLHDFIIDAIYPLTFLEKPNTLLDIGTGAGFPGLLLAFALPQTKVTLCEPLKKRASFLQFIKAKLELENVEVVAKRAEELEPFAYELITSRAVTDTKLLLSISKHLRDEHTKLLFYKGERVFDEVDENLPHKVIIVNKRHYLLIDNSLKKS